jgi:hypothetical protein
MTAFIKTEFSGSECVSYGGKFVARFKRGGKASFLKFLVKNFSVEEYFGRLDAGESPLKILEAKGYLLPHIKKLLKEIGYEVSVTGFHQYTEDQLERRYATI